MNNTNSLLIYINPKEVHATIQNVQLVTFEECPEEKLLSYRLWFETSKNDHCRCGG